MDVYVLVFQIGEFLYLIEGTGDIPLPSRLLPMDSPNVLHVSSTLEGKVNRREESRTNHSLFQIFFSSRAFFLKSIK